MRGQQTLFTQFFGVEQLEVKEAQRPRNFFMPERNNLLVYRYYFYMQIKGYRYEKCLEELEQDLFITGMRAVAVLQECREQLERVALSRPNLKDLQKLFPRMNWNL